MAGFVTVVLFLAVVSSVFVVSERRKATQTYTANADNDSVGVGHVAGGTFGKDSFSSQSNGNFHDNNHVTISNNPSISNVVKVKPSFDFNVNNQGSGNHHANNYRPNSYGDNYGANTYGRYQETYSYGRQAVPYGRRAVPYGRPAGSYGGPVGAYRDPVEYYDPTWYV